MNDKAYVALVDAHATAKRTASEGRRRTSDKLRKGTYNAIVAHTTCKTARMSMSISYLRLSVTNRMTHGDLANSPCPMNRVLFVILEVSMIYSRPDPALANFIQCVGHCMRVLSSAIEWRVSQVLLTMVPNKNLPFC